jgi:hypothetical protein
MAAWRGSVRWRHRAAKSALQLALKAYAAAGCETSPWLSYCNINGSAASWRRHQLFSCVAYLADCGLAAWLGAASINNETQ